MSASSSPRSTRDSRSARQWEAWLASFVNDEVASFTAGDLSLARTDADREARAMAAAEILGGPLDRDAAVRLALVNSPAIQAMLAARWAEGADAAQTGRIPNYAFAMAIGVVALALVAFGTS